MTATRLRIGFIGAGRVGGALAIAISRAGYEVAGIASRSFASVEALAARLPSATAFGEPQALVDSVDLVFLTTPDDAIEATARRLRWRVGAAVVHTSGAASRDVLASAAAQGAATGSLHPLLAFADVDLAVAALPGTVFGVEAEGGLRATLLAIVDALGGKAIELSAADKALYHASAAYAGSHLVTMIKLATDLWSRFGWERGDAIKALLPTMRSTLSNIEAIGVPDALTGPIGRGDIGTVRRNVEAVDAAAPEQSDIYRAIALQTIPLALAKGGLSEPAAAEIRDLLTTRAGTGKKGAQAS